MKPKTYDKKDTPSVCCMIGENERKKERRVNESDGYMNFSIIGWICRRMLKRRKIDCRPR